MGRGVGGAARRRPTAERVARSFRSRSIDVYENDGKRSGAYSAPVYGVHPFMLLNHNDTLDAVFTLAHEMGHNMHTVLAHAHQPFVYSDYTIFVAEVPSTLNEALLLDYLLAQRTDPRERVVLLEHAIENIAGTFFSQVLFADYELRAHRLAETDQPITAEILSDLYGGLLKDYYGDAIDDEPLARLTWARVPHFYGSPYYVYQYATCFASAARLADRMLGGGPGERAAAVERYLDLLKSGGSDYPMSQLQRAGVDLREPDTVQAVIDRFDGLVSRLEGELAALGLLPPPVPGRADMSRLRAEAAWAVGAAVVLLTAGMARGQQPSAPGGDAGLSSLSVPGGTAALAGVAGVESDTPRGVVLLQVIRVLHEAPVGSDAARDERIRRIRAYIADVSEFLTALKALPDGRGGAAQARARATRRALEGVVRSAGGDLDEEGGVHRFVVRDDEASTRRRRHLEAAGVDAAALALKFNAGAIVSFAMPADEVPLPLGAAAWTRLVSSGGPGSGSLLTALLGSRRASLLYYGLMSLDPETLAYVGAHQELLDETPGGRQAGHPGDARPQHPRARRAHRRARRAARGAGLGVDRQAARHRTRAVHSRSAGSGPGPGGAAVRRDRPFRPRAPGVRAGPAGCRKEAPGPSIFGRSTTHAWRR